MLFGSFHSSEIFVKWILDIEGNGDGIGNRARKIRMRDDVFVVDFISGF